MLDFIPPKIVAVLQVATAIGTLRFWLVWFRTEHREPWLPTGYVEHERVFVFPDTILSTLLLVAAALLLLDHPLGARLSLVCGGMMLFLTVIDVAYFAQHRMFARERNGRENLGIVVPLAVMSAVMIGRFL
jgi:hypothetical protein